MEWTDDYVRDAAQRKITLNEKQLKTLILLDIKQRLQSWDKNLKVFGLPEPTKEDIEDAAITESDKMPALIREELDFDIEELAKLIKFSQR